MTGIVIAVLAWVAVAAFALTAAGLALAADDTRQRRPTPQQREYIVTRAACIDRGDTWLIDSTLTIPYHPEGVTHAQQN